MVSVLTLAKIYYKKIVRSNFVHYNDFKESILYMHAYTSK